MNDALKIKPEHTTGEDEAVSRMCREYKVKLNAGDPSPEELMEMIAFLNVHGAVAERGSPEYRELLRLRSLVRDIDRQEAEDEEGRPYTIH